jgi:L-ascorbate metabolism protein UlaG (beta-lactamase superfamily)
MQIYWLGQSCFRIDSAKNKQETAKIVINPFSEEIGLKLPLLEADILLISRDHYDHNNIGRVKGNPFLIQEPGEYEIKDVFVRAIPVLHDDSQEGERDKNIIFTIETEELKLCHLGDLVQKRLKDEQIEKIGSVDILMIPVGGHYTIDGHEAQGIIAQIEPKIVIPMHYFLPRLKIKLEGLEKFLKVMGREKVVETEKKLKIQKKDLPTKETEIVVLDPNVG